MDKNEVFKKNVLKRLYGGDRNVTPGNNFDATYIPEIVIKQGQRLQQGYVSTAAKKIYTVSLPPAGYTLEEQDVTRETTIESDSHSGSDDSGERRGRKRRRRGKVFKSKEVQSGLGFESESDNQTQTNETEKRLTKGNQSDTSGLTKNQKRKLKKKRRKEKEKMQTALQRKEFVYTEANQEEEDNSVVEERTPVLRAEKCDDVLRFLFAVWEVYKAEYETKKDFVKIQKEEPLMLEIEAFLKENENTKELENLYHIKSVLLLGDQNAINQELGSWMSMSDLQKDCQELIEGLSKYWLNIMLKR
ncbi:hypothetical protein ACJMK2_041449 [Sinanodonta woodiana]|uniref:Uncharacterized protein n=1 Tax=Sinanodonta woodiana TaxID=1069815 RepID=A0ABD3W477_SINWO